MASVIGEYNEKLLKSVELFEKQNGNLKDAAIKHFFTGPHNMDLKEQCFFDPDLVGLEKYEYWLKWQK